MNPTRTKVVIINGVTGSGKDTFIELAEGYCELNETANILNISSVDPIKDMLYQFGWDGDRTDKVRNIMADIKEIWINAQNGPTMFLMNNILAFHASHIGEDNIVFCHIREPREIGKLEDAISGMRTVGIDIMSIFIVRSEAICGTYVRDGDDFSTISQYPYDHIIYNDGDLAELDEKVCEFINKLFD